MSKRGHNAIKGKQGFQPIRSANPPKSVAIPSMPTNSSANNPSMANYTYNFTEDINDHPRMRDAETRPPKSFIDNYTWGHAFLNSNQHMSEEELTSRYGTRTVVAAYGAKLDNAIDNNRTSEPNAEFHKSISGDLNAAARLITRDTSGRYPQNVVSAAQRIHNGHLADGKLNPHAVAVENPDETPDKQHFVFSNDAGTVLRAATAEHTQADEDTRAFIAEQEGIASEHRNYFSNPARNDRPKGANLNGLPQPSEELVSERKKLIRAQVELESAAAELRDNKNPFARKKKTAAVTDIQTKVSRIVDRVTYLEKQ
jgi:hypothetical protein